MDLGDLALWEQIRRRAEKNGLSLKVVEGEYTSSYTRINILRGDKVVGEAKDLGHLDDWLRGYYAATPKK